MNDLGVIEVAGFYGGHSIVIPCCAPHRLTIGPNQRPTKKRPSLNEIKPEHWKAWIDSIIDQQRDIRARVQL